MPEIVVGKGQLDCVACASLSQNSSISHVRFALDGLILPKLRFLQKKQLCVCFEVYKGNDISTYVEMDKRPATVTDASVRKKTGANALVQNLKFNFLVCAGLFFSGAAQSYTHPPVVRMGSQ